MNHSQFRLGLDFWCGGKRWRCTDIGTRVITAISLEPHEVVEVAFKSGSTAQPDSRRYITEDPSWLLGPPYKIAETVFDENEMEGCYLTEKEDPDGHFDSTSSPVASK